MNSKKGISLVALAVTIIVLIILASIVLFTTADTTNNAKLVTFASDLSDIEDMSNEYFLSKGEWPVIDGGTSYGKAELLALVYDGKDTLSDEISSNGDNTAQFNVIDLNKLPITNTIRGIKENGDNADVYVISSINHNIYYLKGIKVAGKYYFSLTKELTGKTKISQNNVTDTSNISIESTISSIKLTKSTNETTNSLSINVNTTVDTGEYLTYSIAGTNEVNLVGNTIDVVSILNSNSTAKTDFNNASNSAKVVTVKKYDSSNTFKTSSNINISNLDILSGNVDSVNISYTKQDNFTLANISGYTDLGGSGVKEIRVVYTTKTDDTAYYDSLPATITSEYVYNSGKVSSSSMIKLPSDVKTYVIVFVDNAGNISNTKVCTVSV